MSQEKNVGKRVWYKVEDTDLWALCTVEKFFKGEDGVEMGSILRCSGGCLHRGLSC